MYMVWGEMDKSEAWVVLSSSLERAVAERGAGTKLTGMSSQATREDHLRTLLLMPALGLLKPCALETYSGTVLGQLSRRKRPYSGAEMNHFILSCVRLDWVEAATADVACWGTQLWADDPANESPYRYWDWHVKTVYSDYHLPRTKHGTSNRIVYARKQLMLHDQAGHLLMMKTHRADTNLIEGMVVGTAYYEGLMESRQLTHQIFDREGLSVAHFKELQQAEPQRHFITYLRRNQYEDLESFEEPTAFEPFRYDRKGQVIQEIAEAGYKLKDRRRGEDDLPVRAILLRQPIAQESDEAAKLMVNVTLDQELEADEVARLYQARKVAQENAIRDWWNPLGGDVNIGYAKQPVENSELAKDKADLEKSLNRLADWLVACEKRLQKAQQKQQRLTQQYLTALREAQQKLLVAAQNSQEPGGRTWGQAEKIRLEAELAGLYQQVETAEQKVEEELAKRQCYRQQEAEKKETLTKISQAMIDKPMYQLDDRKDQLMGTLRTCLTNVLQHLRDAVFPTSYAKSTFNTLANFIRMGGYIIEQPQYIEVILDGFWQADKRRDLAEVVARCNERQYTAPDGRPLRFGICRVPGYI